MAVTNNPSTYEELSKLATEQTERAGRYAQDWQKSKFAPAMADNAEQSRWLANNALNIEQAQIDREFQREMSNTAYSRAVKDLEAAGFSPLALLSNPGSSSTPSGSAASSSSAGSYNKYSKSHLQRVGEGFTDLAKTALRILGLVAIKDLSGGFASKAGR